MIQSIPFFKKDWISARIEKINDSTNGIRHIWLKPEKTFTYKPGQNLTLFIPFAKKEADQQRTYSIANAPQKDGILEICVSYVPGGKASSYLFSEIEVGTSVKIKGAFGKFTLPKRIKHDLIFICMGSALAPARSMIQHLFTPNLKRKKVHLIYGVRSREGLLCSDEFSGLAMQYQEFKYSFTFSKEYNASSQTQRKYVHEIYLEQYKKVRLDVLFYISGSLSMIEETVENLLDLGYKKNQIVYDMNF